MYNLESAGVTPEQIEATRQSLIAQGETPEGAEARVQYHLARRKSAGANAPSVAPDNIASQSPISVHLQGDQDWNTGGGSNMYQDERGVWRNRNQGAPSAPRTGSGAGGQPYAFQPVQPQAGNQYAGQGSGQGSGQGGSRGSYGYGGMPAGQGTMNGGTPMSTGSILSFNSDRTGLDRGVWQRGVRDAGGAQAGAQAYGGQASGYAAQLAGVDPQTGAAPRTLYDRYQSLLMDPSSMMQDKNVGFMLDQAQQAAKRQLAAGRMRNSGNALTELAQVTGGNLMSQFGNLANIYGQGAQNEFGRWQGETGAGLDAARIRAGALQGAGNLALGSGQLSVQGGNIAQQQARLELDRVKDAILSPEQQQAVGVRSAAISQMNRGLVASDLMRQYEDLMGTPMAYTGMALNTGQTWYV